MRMSFLSTTMQSYAFHLVSASRVWQCWASYTDILGPFAVRREGADFTAQSDALRSRADRIFAGQNTGIEVVE